MKLNKNQKILIVGLGLIGGSYAEGLTKAGYYVGAIALEQETIDYALEKGIIASGLAEVKEEYVKQFDVIIFALYPHVFIEWMEKYQIYLKSNAVITDVTGVKRAVVYKIQEMLRDDIEFVGAHPMAGKETSGVKNASSEIFKKANYIVTPTDKNTEENIELVRSIGETLGFKNIVTLSPEEHDEMIGFLSQLTHCIAVSLMTCKESEHLALYTGDSFRDLTRIAKINEEMWPELFLLNKDELISQMNLFIKECEKLRDYIKEDDTEHIQDMMRLSTERRKHFDKE